MGIFKKRAYVEQVVSGVVKTIPNFMKLYREDEQRYSWPFIDDKSLCELIAAIFLFYLIGLLLPISSKSYLSQSSRVYQSMWPLLEDLGGEPSRSHQWFTTFGAEMVFGSESTRSGAIRRVIIRDLTCPNGAESEGIADYLSSVLWLSFRSIEKVKLI